MTTPIAIWDWEREPQPPSARVVVCRPGLDSPPGSARWDWTWDSMFKREGRRFVLPYDHARLPRPLPSHIIPALYAEGNAGLAGVGALLSVNADRRALVLCPRGAMDLRECLPQLHWNDPRIGLRERPNAWGAIDIVVIIPPPEARACPGCAALPVNSVGDCSRCGRHGPGPGHICRGCPTCNGSGRIEPWPLHPAWIRGIVEQCRAAGVSVVFLGWGEWVPTSHLTEASSEAWASIRKSGKREETRLGDDQALFYRVGAEHSGRTLNDDEVMDLPEWLT